MRGYGIWSEAFFSKHIRVLRSIRLYLYLKPWKIAFCIYVGNYHAQYTINQKKTSGKYILWQEIILWMRFSGFNYILHIRVCNYSRVRNRSRPYVKVIYPKYSKHWTSTMAHNIDCVCIKMLNTFQAYTLPHTLNMCYQPI